MPPTSFLFCLSIKSSMLSYKAEASDKQEAEMLKNIKTLTLEP
jgi:hypothetical protein